MRILLTTDVVGGVWRYTVTLVRELVARGHECAVAVLGDPEEERLKELPDEVDVFSRDLRLEWMPEGLADLDEGTRWLQELATDWKADITHLNQYGYAAGDFPAAVVVVAHSDVLSWFDHVRGQEPPAEWAEYREVVRRGIEGADVVVAPTAYQSGGLARHYGRSAVRVIHNGIPSPPADEDLPPASERPLVLVAGRAWDEAKGIGLLDEAVGELGDDAPSVHLIGPLSGPAGETIEAEHLVTHGEVSGPTMARFYRNTRLYVGPSLYEPFGLSPLEAACHGCGLLLSGIGSFRELWTGAAAFFEPLYADVLASRLRDVLADDAGLDDLAREARTRGLTRYTARRMADNYERLYQDLLPSGDARSGPALSAPSPSP